MSDEQQSPRDWLLARHADAEPRLDAARAAVLAGLRVQRAAELQPETIARPLRALFYPHRFAWGALSAVWIGLLVFHFTLGRPAPEPTATRIPPAAIAAWLAQSNPHAIFAQNDHRD